VQAIEVGQFLQARVCHPGREQVQLSQVVKVLEFLEPEVRHLSGGQVQGLRVGQGGL
jgi:hypothetical protein